MVRRAPALIELEAFQLSLPTQSGMRSFCRQLQVSPVELLYSMVPAHGPVKGGPGPVGAKAFRGGGGRGHRHRGCREAPGPGVSGDHDPKAAGKLGMLSFLPNVSILGFQRLPWMLTAFLWCWKS